MLAHSEARVADLRGRRPARRRWRACARELPALEHVFTMVATADVAVARRPAAPRGDPTTLVARGARSRAARRRDHRLHVRHDRAAEGLRADATQTCLATMRDVRAPAPRRAAPRRRDLHVPAAGPLARAHRPARHARRRRDARVLERRSQAPARGHRRRAPDHLPSVPRVFEKIHAQALAAVEESSPVRRRAVRAGRSPPAAARRAAERRGDTVGRCCRAGAARSPTGSCCRSVRDLFGGELRLGAHRRGADRPRRARVLRRLRRARSSRATA